MLGSVDGVSCEETQSVCQGWLNLITFLKQAAQGFNNVFGLQSFPKSVRFETCAANSSTVFSKRSDLHLHQSLISCFIIRMLLNLCGVSPSM